LAVVALTVYACVTVDLSALSVQAVNLTQFRYKSDRFYTPFAAANLSLSATKFGSEASVDLRRRYISKYKYVRLYLRRKKLQSVCALAI